MIAVGVDTHKEEHDVVAALDALGQLVGETVVAASETGYRELAAWLDRLGEGVLVGIEGAGSYGAGLCEHLLAVGVRVVEVERPRRRDRRAGKTDRVDARLAAKKVLVGEGLSTPRTGGARAALQALLVAYRSCVNERTRLLNQLQAVHVTAPLTLREWVGRGNGEQLTRRLSAMRARPGASLKEATVLAVLRDLARRARALDQQARRYEREIATLVRSLDATLLEETGVGPISAGKLLASDPARFKSEAAFARSNGTAPQPASLGGSRSATGSRAVATGRSTTRSTRSRSHARSTTPRRAPTSPAGSPRAKPNGKRCDR